MNKRIQAGLVSLAASFFMNIAVPSLTVGLFSGCSVGVVLQRPSKKDLSVLQPGTPRERVVAELGSPAMTETKAGLITDVFSFEQGISGLSKAARGFGHLVMDLLTLCLWEIISYPTESALAGVRAKMKVEVTYDEKENISKSREIE